MNPVTEIWAFASLWTHLAGALACAGVAAWYLQTPGAVPEQRRAVSSALGLTALWCLLVAATGPFGEFAMGAETLRNLGWLWVLQALFAGDGEAQSARATRPVIFVLALVVLMQSVLAVLQGGLTGEAQMIVVNISALLHLLVAVGVLLVLHNLYVGTSGASRRALRWPAGAMATLWAYDLNFYTITYLTETLPLALAAARGAVAAALCVPLAIGATRVGKERRFQPSRKVAFQTLALIAVGAYLLVMVGIARGILLIGGDIGRVTQVGFLFLAGIVALIWLPSRRLRDRLRVTATKHLFQHRYDYRAEWLRFAETIGRDSAAAPLPERIVKAIADIADAPRGLLLLPGDEGDLHLAARWNWKTVEIPAEAMSIEAGRFFEETGFIVALDELRSGEAGHWQSRSEETLPAWLTRDPTMWAAVPLLHFGRLVGVAVLARPEFERRLDWEDLDLLRVVGQQSASFLAEQAGEKALLEAGRFEEFNRRIAFVMHDIKNLASQLSLLARNAERHADNPEFRVDMLVTLRNSADKLNALLARLGRYGSASDEEIGPIPLAEVAKAVCARYEAIHPVMLTQEEPVVAMGRREAFEQALVHLVQNAVDASKPDRPVYLRVGQVDLSGQIELVDSGTGMSAGFIQRDLFRPFHSSKQGGFGIGAFEARELLRAMGGTLAVESREGLGTRFFIRLPLRTAGALGPDDETTHEEVARWPKTNPSC